MFQLLTVKSNELFQVMMLFSDCSIVAIGKPERQVRKASHCGSKQQ